MTGDLHAIQLSDSDSLAIAYIQDWEANWKNHDSYSEIELRAIRCSLFSAVIHRYSKTGEMGFTKAELKQAIAAATEVQKPAKVCRTDDSVNTICYDYVKLFIEHWDHNGEFSDDEIKLIFTRLYVSVKQRYESSRRTRLSFTKRELKSAIESVSVYRERVEKEARFDARDRKVRELRSKYGSFGEAKFHKH